MKTPDVTPAQILAGLTTIIGLFATQGLIDNKMEKLIAGIAAILIPMTWKIADAIIRHGRSRAFQYPPKPVEATVVDASPTDAAPGA